MACVFFNKHTKLSSKKDTTQYWKKKLLQNTNMKKLFLLLAVAALAMLNVMAETRIK